MWVKLCVRVNSDCAMHSVSFLITKRQFHATFVARALLKLAVLSQHGVVAPAKDMVGLTYRGFLFL